MKVALGVTGCIGAYKAVQILRGLQKRGVDVQVVMTRSATQFVTPLTFQAISGHPVVTEMFAPTDDPEIKHIEIGQSVDLLLVAPATANILAKFAHGISDDFLSTLYISTTAPVLVAPAMNVEMWANPATQKNVKTLRKRGVYFVDPEEGYLACRTVGAGRLADPDNIVERAMAIMEGRNSLIATPPKSYITGELEAPDKVLTSPVDAAVTSDIEKIGFAPASAIGAMQELRNEHILITAGPTVEAIDPVRWITNRSSGKMGYAIAETALRYGAKVTLVTGPVSITPPSQAHTISVKSAREMYDAVIANLDSATIVIMAAAVADYRPVKVADQKIKKTADKLVIELEKTDDILASVGQIKGDRVLVGFAAETENVIENAHKKLIEKRADLIVANDVSSTDSGFDVDTNRVILLSTSTANELPLMTKAEVAYLILDTILLIKSKANTPAF
jgi:phosphopantothenoylcysteine decarboxylase/phosphopantothenate--cysteine ligase